MIVVGTDPHKSKHVFVAVEARTGEYLTELKIEVSNAGFHRLEDWAGRLKGERIFAIEDCRQVSGSLERFLLKCGERIVRVAPKHMAGARRSVRDRGKSDPIDALAVARAALREGIENLPPARLDPEAEEIKLLADHRDDLVREGTRIQNRLRWHLHDLWPGFEIPLGSLDHPKWLDRLSRKLNRAPKKARVRICLQQVRQLRSISRQENELTDELKVLVETRAPELLELPGCGVLTAAKLIGETSGRNFISEAKFARMGGLAPIPASSGKTERHRLDRGGNRQLNCAIHRIAVTQGRCYGPAQVYLTRKQAEGKSRKEAIRCLKRQLVRPVLKHLNHSLETIETT
jgi:transposase